jgi:hypothetical protein
MRFRFCGELDAPDWLLAEISTLSKLASIRPSTAALRSALLSDARALRARSLPCACGCWWGRCCRT